MRTSLAGRSGPAGLTRALLLALALGACGGGDENRGGSDAAGTRAARTAAAAGDTAAADTCTGPPPGYTVPVLNGPWQALLDSLAADSVAFPDIAGNDDTASVKLCRSCSRVAVEIRSSSLTPCLRPEDLQGPERRITGMFILQETFPAQHGWDTIPAGDTLFVFTNSTSGPATLVYDHGGSGKSAPSTAWQFWYCRDGHSGKTPQAQWRSRGTPTTSPGKGKDEEEEEDDGGSYGWMACASGCCQFYTPPPNEVMLTTPEQASETAPDTVGVSQRPYWCPAR